MLPVAVDEDLDAQARLRAHRDLVRAVEDELRKHPPRPIEVTHHFAHELYGREGVLPKGTWATGRIHRFSQINVICNGDISVLTPDGEVRYRGPVTFVTPAGTKRLVYAHEDTTWITIVGTPETDVGTIVEKLTVDTEEEYARHLELTHGKILEIE